jgi:membrane associated rhomboid family serine protease
MLHDLKMDHGLERIPTNSQRQAMDWSLVLASQGIEAIISSAQDGAGWGLLVTTQDYQAARDAIHQFRAENPAWKWQQKVLQPNLIFDWASLAWVLLLALFFWLETRMDLRLVGIMSRNAIGRGEWWRLFTAMWLHADLAHFAANATLGLVLLGLAMGRYGTGVGLLGAYMAGLGGYIIDFLVVPHPQMAQGGSLGASGMVMGCLGLLASQALSLRRQTPHAFKYITGGILGGVMLFVLLGLAPDTDVVAHLGGFLTGLLFGALLVLFPKLSQSTAANLLSGLIFSALVILPWFLALKGLR